MALLQLPVELFDPIMRRAIDPLSVERAVQLRSVCKTFDRWILNSLFERAIHLDFSRLFQHTGFNELFKTHAAEILAKRVLSPQTHLREHAVVQCIRSIVSTALTVSKFSNPHLRVQYTHHVCQSMMVTDPKLLRKYLTRRVNYNRVHLASMIPLMLPAVAAAIRDPDTLRESVGNHKDLLAVHSEIIPNALDAAVSSGQMESLAWILAYLKAGVLQADDHEETRAVSNSIGQALRIAIRLFQYDAGSFIFDWLHDNRDFRKSMHEGFGQQLVQDCIMYNNAKMVYGACAYRSRGSYTTLEHGKLSGLRINKFDEFQILKYGRAAFLEALIGYGFFDPKKNTLKGCYGEHWFEGKRGFGLACVLVQHGATVQVYNCSRFCAPLMLRVVRSMDLDAKGTVNVVKFLLEQGAEPDDAKDGPSPLQISMTRNKMAKCTYLLHQVKVHGKGFLQSPDLGDGYEDSKAVSDDSA